MDRKRKRARDDSANGDANGNANRVDAIDPIDDEDHRPYKIPTHTLEGSVPGRMLAQRWSSVDAITKKPLMAKHKIPGVDGLANFHYADSQKRGVQERISGPNNRRSTILIETSGTPSTAAEAAANPTGTVGEAAYNSCNERKEVAWKAVRSMLKTLATDTLTLEDRGSLQPHSSPASGEDATGEEPEVGAAAATASADIVANTVFKTFTTTHHDGVREDSIWTAQPLDGGSLFGNSITEQIDATHIERSMVGAHEPFQACCMGGACVFYMRCEDVLKSGADFTANGITYSVLPEARPACAYLPETVWKDTVERYQQGKPLATADTPGFCFLCIVRLLDYHIVERMLMPQDAPALRTFNPFYIKNDALNGLKADALYPITATARHGIWGCVPVWIPDNFMLGFTGRAATMAASVNIPGSGDDDADGDGNDGAGRPEAEREATVKEDSVNVVMTATANMDRAGGRLPKDMECIRWCMRLRRGIIMTSVAETAAGGGGRVFDFAAINTAVIDSDLTPIKPAMQVACSLEIPTMDRFIAAILKDATKINVSPAALHWVGLPLSVSALALRTFLSQQLPCIAVPPDVLNYVLLFKPPSTNTNKADPKENSRVVYDPNVNSIREKIDNVFRQAEIDSEITMELSLELAAELAAANAEEIDHAGQALGPDSIEAVEIETEEGEGEGEGEGENEEEGDAACPNPDTPGEVSEEVPPEAEAEPEPEPETGAEAEADSPAIIPFELLHFYGQTRLCERLTCPWAIRHVAAIVRDILVYNVRTYGVLSNIAHFLTTTRRISILEHVYHKTKVVSEDMRRFLAEVLHEMRRQYMWFASRIVTGFRTSGCISDEYQSIPRELLVPTPTCIPKVLAPLVRVCTYVNEQAIIPVACAAFLESMGTTSRVMASLITSDFSKLLHLLAKQSAHNIVARLCMSIGSWKSLLSIENPDEMQTRVLLALNVRVRACDHALEQATLRNLPANMRGRHETRLFRDSHIPLVHHLEGANVTDDADGLSTPLIHSLLAKASYFYPYPARALSDDDLPIDALTAIRAMGLLGSDSLQFPMREKGRMSTQVGAGADQEEEEEEEDRDQEQDQEQEPVEEEPPSAGPEDAQRSDNSHDYENSLLFSVSDEDAHNAAPLSRKRRKNNQLNTNTKRKRKSSPPTDGDSQQEKEWKLPEATDDVSYRQTGAISNDSDDCASEAERMFADVDVIPSPQELPEHKTSGGRARGPKGAKRPVGRPRSDKTSKERRQENNKKKKNRTESDKQERKKKQQETRTARTSKGKETAHAKKGEGGAKNAANGGGVGGKVPRKPVEKPECWGDVILERPRTENLCAAWGGRDRGMNLMGLTRMFSKIVRRTYHLEKTGRNQVRCGLETIARAVTSDAVCEAFVAMAITLGVCGLYKWSTSHMSFDHRLDAASVMEAPSRKEWLLEFVRNYPAISVVCVLEAWVSCARRAPAMYAALLDNMPDFREFAEKCIMGGQKLSEMIALKTNLTVVEETVVVDFFGEGPLAPPPLPPTGLSTNECLQHISSRAYTRRVGQARVRVAAAATAAAKAAENAKANADTDTEAGPPPLLPGRADSYQEIINADFSEYAQSESWRLTNALVNGTKAGTLPSLDIIPYCCVSPDLTPEGLARIRETLQTCYDVSYRKAPVDRAVTQLSDLPNVEYVHAEGFLRAITWHGRVSSTFISCAKVVAAQAFARQWCYRKVIPPPTRRFSDAPVGALYAKEADMVPKTLTPAMEAFVVRPCCNKIASFMAPAPGNYTTEIALGHLLVECAVHQGGAVICHNHVNWYKKQNARLNAHMSDPSATGKVFLPSERNPKLSCSDTSVYMVPSTGRMIHLGETYKHHALGATGAMTIVIATCCGRQADLRYCTVGTGGVYCNACRENNVRRTQAQPQRRARILAQMCALCMAQNEKCMPILELHDSDLTGPTFELTVSALCPKCFTYVMSAKEQVLMDNKNRFRVADFPCLIFSRSMMNRALSKRGRALAEHGFDKSQPLPKPKRIRRAGLKNGQKVKKPHVSRVQRLTRSRPVISLYGSFVNMTS